jgi:hypothetical protein
MDIKGMFLVIGYLFLILFFIVGCLCSMLCIYMFEHNGTFISSLELTWYVYTMVSSAYVSYKMIEDLF